MVKKIANGERVVPENIKTRYEYMLYIRHLFAYETVCQMLPAEFTVLEIGCGEGYGANLLAKYSKEVIAIDNNSFAIQHATKKYSSNNLKFLSYDGNKLPFDNNRFDAVISFQVIEHIEDDIKFISEVYRVLKDKGKLIFTTPNKKYRLKPGQKPWYQFHIREYDKDEFEDLLETIFNKVKVSYINAPLEIYNTELKLAKLASLVQTCDLLNLRKLISYNMKRKVIQMFSFINNLKDYSQKERNLKNKYNTKDFFISNDETRGLDLFAICEKI